MNEYLSFLFEVINKRKCAHDCKEIILKNLNNIFKELQSESSINSYRIVKEKVISDTEKEILKAEEEIKYIEEETSKFLKNKFEIDIKVKIEQNISIMVFESCFTIGSIESLISAYGAHSKMTLNDIFFNELSEMFKKLHTVGV